MQKWLSYGFTLVLFASVVQAEEVAPGIGWHAVDMPTGQPTELTFHTFQPSMFRATVALYTDDTFMCVFNGEKQMEAASFSGISFESQGEKFYSVIQPSWENPDFDGLEWLLESGSHSVMVTPESLGSTVAVGVRVDPIPEPMTLTLFLPAVIFIFRKHDLPQGKSLLRSPPAAVAVL